VCPGRIEFEERKRVRWKGRIDENEAAPEGKTEEGMRTGMTLCRVGRKMVGMKERILVQQEQR